MRRRRSSGGAQQPQQRPHEQQQQQNQRLIHGPRCSLLMLLIVGQAVYASSASELIANRSTPSNSTPDTPRPTPKISSPFREPDVAEGEVDWGAGQHPLTISRPPRAGRSERQAEEDQVDRCRLFVEGDPTKNELYSPEYPNLYPKNINCTRVITAPKGQIIRLDFRNSFNIEAKEECKFDFLEIRDGQYGFSTLIGKFCGTDFPPEITSKERYLWLHFHSDETIEYTGFSAVYEYLDRNREAPSTDLNCTIEKGGFEGFINSTDVPAEIREQVNHNKIALDCIWRIQVKENWKIFLKFLDFKLSKPNDCDTNFLDIFPEQTVMPLRVKNFCGSAGESITADSNILHLRFYADQIAINSTFGILFTAFRDRGAACTEDEYDCEDATCISKDLKCNSQDNCKFRWDEEGCTGEAAGQSEHVVIIVIVFGLILGGMVITFIVNCIRKIIRDQKIIREHIRESKESKLDEMGSHSKGRSRENISRQKHSQTSLQILDDVSNRYYREAVPLSTQSSKADFKEKEHSILRRHADMTQTSLCGITVEDDDESSSTTTATHELRTKASMSAVPSNACDMGCQTRESLFVNSPGIGPSAGAAVGVPVGIGIAVAPGGGVGTLMRQKSSSSSLGGNSGSGVGIGAMMMPPPPPRFFSTFGYEPSGSPAVATLTRRSMHQQQHQQQHHQLPRQESIEMEERHSGRSHYGGLLVASTVKQPQEICHHHHQHQQQQQQHAQQQHAQQQHAQQQHLAQQQQQPQRLHHAHPHPHPPSIAARLPTMKGHGAMGQTTILPGSNKQQQQQHQQHQQQQQKNEESKVFIDIRNSAPDVIIMTSH
ncbi:uncharacterized protein LOC119556215 [Drosophila subpulchrella]|uniref:uncharacterized protein LOC119556215 n=1 Tax=Drosophila subpulchrella TaxID=1486046 RepID=UPI0018A16A8A|nr:uncharacterized protein LOC119556215 [Drosophila subpulchrella]XP_037724124.1 uncharacterized protein LOC119556215 [Drosophila subpulchrella]XP_037724126.1 uncharacterized protein LOC119556215 [Drosophila subpulchrella]XP_037724127.1 uncharacterized protein LOC119556215 [Drosophila subpulchrella]